MPDDRPDLRRLSRSQLVVLVAAGLRREGEAPRAQAEAAWRVLIARDFDRVCGLVATFRFSGREQVRIDVQDREDAVQYAYARLLAMLPNFRGTSEGEYTAALARCVEYACMDFCRRQMRHERRSGGSFDEARPDSEGEARGRFDWLLERTGARRRDDEARGREELDALARALASLRNEKMRRVISHTIEGHSSSEIAQDLGLSVANVDTLRSRGLRKLGELEDNDG